MSTSQDLQTHIESALHDGLSELSGEGRTERIHYLAADYSGTVLYNAIGSA